MILASLLALPSFVVVPPTALANDHWPGFRGDGSGVASGSPPTKWSEDENVRWKAPIPGKGNSSPVIWGDRVFLTTAVPIGEPAEEEPAPQGGSGRGRGRSEPIVEQAFLVLALDRKDGSVVWERTASEQTPHQGTHRDGTYASPTIVTDGEMLIASFGSYGFYAYDFAGELLWKTDLGDMDIRRSFGEGSSPVLVGNKLVVVWDHEGESFVTALDKKTGKELWRTPRDLGTTWVTPVVVDAKGGKQVIVATAKTIAYSLETGEEVWSHTMPVQSRGGGRGRGRDRGGDRSRGDGGQGGQGRSQGRGGGGDAPRPGGGVVTMPVLFEDVVLYSSGSRGGAFCAVRYADASGEIDKAKSVVWESSGDTPFIPSPIAHDGILYSLKQNSGLLSAYDAMSGERIYGPERMAGLANAYASPVIAGDHLYFVGRDGTSEVVALGPEFESVSVNVLDDAFDATPAVAGNELYLRGLRNVYCIAKVD